MKRIYFLDDNDKFICRSKIQILESQKDLNLNNKLIDN
jgi:hypothetical protein